MSKKQAILRGLIDNIIYELFPQTDIYSVWVDDNTTLAEKLYEVITSLNGKVTPEQMKDAIAKAVADIDIEAPTGLPVTPDAYEGTTTQKFQQALANNRRVFVPGGDYYIDSELVIRDNCQLELAQDATLRFTQTSGNCISMKASSSIVGNHGAIIVPYAFSGRVINIYAGLDESIKAVPPFTAWGPMWMAARYITDLHIAKVDYRGVAQSVDGTCSGTAVYLGASCNDPMNFLWAVDLTRLRISGPFTYGIHMDTVMDGMTGWIHQTRISAFVDGAEIGVYAKNSTMSYLSVMVIPRRALTTAGEYLPYAKHGIYLENCTDVDLSGSRVIDWNSTYTLWAEGNMYQHIALIGDCSGLILNEIQYYAMSTYDIRDLIYTDTPSNLERLTILQEPFTRWFKPKDHEPYFFDGDSEKRIALQEDLDCIVDGERTALFTNVLPMATDAAGNIYNGIGYTKSGTQLTSSGGVAENAYTGCTGFIPVKQGDVIYTKNLTIDGTNVNVVTYDANKAYIAHGTSNTLANMTWFFDYTPGDDGFTLKVKERSTTAYIRFGYRRDRIGERPIISINEPIKYTNFGYLSDGIKVKASQVEGLPSGGGSGGGAQSDWNAAEGEPGHILNRTHYTEVKNAEIYSDTGLVPDPDMGMIVVSESIPVTVGEEYTVKWNGVDHTCTCVTVDGSASILGNMVIDGGEDTGEPFCIITYSDQGMSALVPLDGSEQVAVSISGSLVDVHELDEKYIAAALANSESRMQNAIDSAIAQFETGKKLFSNIDIQYGYSSEVIEGAFDHSYPSGMLKAFDFTILGQNYDVRLPFYFFKSKNTATFIFSGNIGDIKESSSTLELRIQIDINDKCHYYLRDLHV